jgi:transcriptional regulator with XRE-family HTH domain
MQEIREIDTATPQIRWELHARVKSRRYKTYSDLAQKMGITLPQLSRILNGWEFPSSTMQKRLARELGLSVSDLRRLL